MIGRWRPGFSLLTGLSIGAGMAYAATLQAAGGSALACLGVSGYVIGLALPVSPGLDLPLVFLVALAVLAAIASPQQRRLGDSLVALPLLAFVAARLASALAAPEPLRSLKMVAPVLPGLLLFFVLSEWVRTEHHVAVVYVSLTAAGLVLAVFDCLVYAQLGAALLEALKSPAFYVGALGSRKNNDARRQRLAGFDLSGDEIAKLHGPVGLKIGAKTPPEIAVAILAEMTAVRRGVAVPSLEQPADPNVVAGCEVNER